MADLSFESISVFLLEDRGRNVVLRECRQEKVLTGDPTPTDVHLMEYYLGKHFITTPERFLLSQHLGTLYENGCHVLITSKVALIAIRP